MKVKLRAGNLYIPVTLETRSDDRIYFHFSFNRSLIDEVKASFEGRKWHGPPVNKNGEKIWSIPNTQRNQFQLARLEKGKNPYAPWDAEPKEFETRHPLMGHQREMAGMALAVNWFIWAAEMGTGKTLAAFTVMEESGLLDWWWVGPKSALRAVYAEKIKWKLQIEPRFMTYDSLRTLVARWTPGDPAPQGIIFDESSRLKNPTAKRSLAAKHVADAMRTEYGRESFIGLLSGSPAPKSPADWWWQCEIACPGFLREANYYLFRERLGVYEDRETVAGAGSYRHLNNWKDDENRCDVCGEFADHENHGLMGNVHVFKPSKNEVAFLYKRMKGLVGVWTKAKCLDLPEKRYDVIRCEPSAEVKRAAQLIVAGSARTIEALTKLRELSDGFQYQEKVVGTETCQRCHGTREAIEWRDPEHPDTYPEPEAVERGVRFIYTEIADEQGIITDYEITGEEPCQYQEVKVPCEHCGATGATEKKERVTVQVPCPKEDVLIEQLDLHEEIGRFNVYAGFTGSIDRCVEICHQQGWTTIRADGRGWSGVSPVGELLPSDKLLEIFDKGHEAYPRVCFIGQPGAAGMGLTLTASPTTMFWSNDFNAESRIQAEDRGHRIGMDRERGGRIVDIIHLDSDQYVLDNLQKKRQLQRMSMTGLKNLFKEEEHVGAQ